MALSEPLKQQFNTGPVNFRKIRTYGEVINTSFVFVRAYKSILFSMMMKLMLPYLVVFSAGLGLLMNGIFSMSEARSSMNGDDNIFSILWTVGFGLLIMLVVIVTYLLANATQLAFIGQVIQKGTQFSYEDVRKVVRKKFFPYFGMLIVIGLSVGTVQQIFLYIIVLPTVALSPFIGIIMYLVFYVVVLFASSITSMIPMPMFIDNARGGNSPNRVFKVMKGNWWITVGVDTTMLIVMYVILSSLLLPIALAFGIAYLFAPGMFQSATMIQDYKWFIIVYTSLNAFAITFAGFYLMIIRNVTLALQYTNLVERSEAFGLAERIKRLVDAQDAELSFSGLQPTPAAIPTPHNEPPHVEWDRRSSDSTVDSLMQKNNKTPQPESVDKSAHDTGESDAADNQHSSQ
ncbi:MAG: hypothetical protein JNL32_02810 [Candidatus Kapabacteria bacterium]|nr:hypothetical protein [Candidatus Kapabacteria bacterium]